MVNADNIKNNIMDKSLAILKQDTTYQFDSTSALNDDIIKLSESQILILNKSEDDINNNRIVAQGDLDEMDMEWLKAL